jgi:D-beta-D-heptose 7-phosphate kinase/D-beta-D-heptose 1-phosphate adenosyltransferase
MKSFNFTLTRLRNIISSFKEAKVLVVGDLILDEFIWGKVFRISPEAPVPVVWVDSENFMPGGASNVANNIRALGGEVYLTGVVGEDARGEILRGLLRKKGVFCEGIFSDKQRLTTQKTRVIAHHQQVVRIDREVLRPVSGGLLKEVLNFIRKKIKEVDALLIEDYGKGVVVPGLVQTIVKIAKKHKKIITQVKTQENGNEGAKSEFQDLYPLINTSSMEQYIADLQCLIKETNHSSIYNNGEIVNIITKALVNAIKYN